MFRAAVRSRRQAGKALQDMIKQTRQATYTTATKLASSTTGGFSSTATAAAVLAVAATTTFAMQPVLHAKASSEKTYIMVKPDGVQRGLVGEIISRFERKGFKLVAIKVVVPTKEVASEHYAEHKGKPFFPKLVDFLSSGAVVGMVWEGQGVISYGRTLIGATNPLNSAPGTIRGDFGIATGRNLVHGSDSVESAMREVSIWFTSDELAQYKLSNAAWVYE